MILRTRSTTRRAVGANAALVAIAMVCLVGVTTAGVGASSGHYFGSTSRVALNRPIVGMAATPSGLGYWLVAADGGVFAFGDARFHGSTGAHPLSAPVVGIAATRSGHGYWLVARDGGVFSFGDARFHGSTGAHPLSAPVVGIAATRSGHGYWLVARDGGVFSFGDARFHGSTGAHPLSAPVVGIAATRFGHGYWLAAADGEVFAFGDAAREQSSGRHVRGASIIGISTMASGRGYWLAETDGRTLSFGRARRFETHFASGAVSRGSADAVVAIAASPEGGYWVASLRGAVGTSASRPTPRRQYARPSAKPSTERSVKRSPAFSDAIALQLLARMNEERAARHQLPLAWDALLAQRAHGWARHLLSTGQFQHQNLGSIANAAKGRFEEVGENLFSGTGSAADAGTAHLALMASDDHRSNMLLRQGQLVGIGAACLGHTLLVVEDFAIKMGARLPPPGQPIPPAKPVAAADPNGASC